MNTSLSVKLSLPTRVQPEVMPESGMAGIYTNQLHFFKKHFLDELSKKKYASDFMRPVDTRELQIPHYYAVINRPMDVGTIIKRVENNYYRDIDEAIADFRQIIRNCMSFNGVDTLVRRKGIQLERFFNRVMMNMPKGPAVPCNKDPVATTKLKPNSMADAMQLECREQLRLLQTYTHEVEATARNHFGPKWNSLSGKLDKQFFKTLEEFRSHVDALFNKYHGQANHIYGKVYKEPGGCNFNCVCACHWNNSAGSVIAAQDLPNNGNTPTIEEEKIVPAGFYLPADRLEFLVDTPDAGVYEDDPKLEPISQEERANIQTQFGKLPRLVMREICTIVHSNEILGLDNAGVYSFDLKQFELVNVHLMKAAVARAVKLHSKVNLRDMQPEEKEDLRSSLQSQLSDITKRLSQSRRKNAASSASQKTSNNAKTNGTQRRGKKRAKSPDTMSEMETAATKVTKNKPKSSPTKQETPPKPVQQTIVESSPKRNKEGKSKKNEGQNIPNEPKTPRSRLLFTPGGRVTRKPYNFSGTSQMVPKTPGKYMGGRNVLLAKTPKLTPGGRIFIKRNLGRQRVRRGGARAVQPEPAQPEPAGKPAKKMDRLKTLADTSSDDDDDYDNKGNNDDDKPSSSNKPQAQKSKKSKTKKWNKSNGKSSLFLTPGNVLNVDLSLSSSSDED